MRGRPCPSIMSRSLRIRLSGDLSVYFVAIKINFRVASMTTTAMTMVSSEPATKMSRAKRIDASVGLIRNFSDRSSKRLWCEIEMLHRRFVEL